MCRKTKCISLAILWIGTTRRFKRCSRVFREGRYGRAEKMVKKLTALGAPITFERVKEIAGDASIGRPHVAQALVEAGHVATITEAFDRFIGRTGPAYVERFRLTPQDAVTLILRAGGVPVLAHPREVTAWIEPLVKVGLVGLEALYGMYDEPTRAHLVHLARQYDLLVTGGKRFSRFESNGVPERFGRRGGVVRGRGTTARACHGNSRVDAFVLTCKRQDPKGCVNPSGLCVTCRSVPRHPATLCLPEIRVRRHRRWKRASFVWRHRLFSPRSHYHRHR
jgi:hypothetical protein